MALYGLPTNAQCFTCQGTARDKGVTVLLDDSGVQRCTECRAMLVRETAHFDHEWVLDTHHHGANCDPYTGEIVIRATGYPAVPTPQPLRFVTLV